MQTSDDEYDDFEIRSTLADIERYERAPLADRRAAIQRALDARDEE